MPNPVKCLFEVHKDMVEVLLMLEVSLAYDPEIKDLLCGATPWSEACLFFSNDLFCLWIQSVQHDLQHDFARVANEADCAVILTLL